MKLKYVLLIIYIIGLFLFTVFCPTKEDGAGTNFYKTDRSIDFIQRIGTVFFSTKGDDTGSIFYKTDRSIDFSQRIGTVKPIGFTSAGWFGSRQLPTAMFKNTSSQRIDKQDFENPQVFNLKHVANYAVLPMQNTSYQNEQVEVHFSDLNDTKIYSSPIPHKDSPVLKISDNELAQLFPAKADDLTPVILEESTSKIQYGFLAMSTSVNLDNAGIGEENLDARRITNIDPDEDPVGPPIPIPDGLWVLLLFAISYAGWINFSK